MSEESQTDNKKELTSYQKHPLRTNIIQGTLLFGGLIFGLSVLGDPLIGKSDLVLLAVFACFMPALGFFLMTRYSSDKEIAIGGLIVLSIVGIIYWLLKYI